MGYGASYVNFGFQGGGGGGGGGSQSWAQVLVVGNESGGNNPIISEGDVLSFGSNTSFYGDLFVGTTSLTANRTWELPNQSGVIALVSDIPANTNIYNSNGNIPTSRVVTVDNLAGSLLFQNGSSQALFSMTFDGIFRLGLAASAFDNSTVTIGAQAVTSVANAIAIGNQANVAGADSLAIGYLANAQVANSIVIGRSANSGSTVNGNNVIIGNYASNNSYGVTIVGYNTSANGAVNGTIIGIGASATGQETVAIGAGSQANGFWSTSIGRSSLTSNQVAVAVGANSTASGSGSIAIGYFASASQTSSIAIGQSAQAAFNNNIAIGTTSNASGTQAIAIGRRITSSGSQSITLGDSPDNATTLTNSTNNSFGIGWTKLNPDMLFAKSVTSYLNFTGSFWIGDGSAAANEGAPNNIPASISKLTVKGNIEVVGNGTGNVGVVVEADDGNRVLMQLVEVSTGVYAWNTGTIV